MPYTDAQLATQMGNDLVNSNVMTQAELIALRNDPTENNVRETLTAEQLGNFNNYWLAIGNWVDAAPQGGNFATMSGNLTVGRVGGNPVGIAARALYNDAFKDVRDHIGQPDFSAVKAVSSQLRFIENI